MKKIYLAFLVPLLILGCTESGAAWSQSDKDNIQHFFFSLESSIAATALQNEIGQGRQPRSRMTEVIELRKLALKEADIVRDSVLRKANEDLPQNFRNLYEKSLEYFIQAFEDKDNQAMMRYSTLAEQWGSWYSKNKRAIKIPK